MKVIIAFTLIVVIFFIIGLIILNKLEMCGCTRKNKTVQVNEEVLEHFADTVALPNINIVLNGGLLKDSTANFFERADDNVPVSCTADEDCKGTGEKCLTIDSSKECVKQTTIKAYELKSEKTHFIELPIEPTRDYSPKHNTANFKFSFNFVLKNATTKKYIIHSKSKRWGLYYEDGDIYLVVFEMKGGKKVESESLKINSSTIFSYQLYRCTINTFDDRVIAVFDTQSDSKEIFFKDFPCKSDGSCDGGEECSGEIGNKKCLIKNGDNAESYYFGTKDISGTKEDYTDMYIGEFKYLSTASTCDFYPDTYKNKRKCIADCKKTNCANCTTLCKDVPVCEFEPMGRHSIDCIQHCIKNVDCTAAFCKQKCEGNCGTACPWSGKQDVESYDSQYYDKDGKPSALKIILANTSTDGTKVTIKWRPAYPGKMPVEGYMSYLYKTFKKSEAVKINKINKDICSEFCEYVISDLQPNETYTFGVKAYNNIGLGQMSNLVTFKAEVTSLTFDLNIDYEVDANDVGSYNYCTDV